ncbi:MAG: DUF2617 family protein [Planctomycetota bacterium]
MSQTIKAGAAQSHHVILYERALHPELFQLRERDRISRPTYELEAWLMPGSHALRFEHGGGCLSELVTESIAAAPDSGVVASFAAAGEHDFDRSFATRGVTYMTTVQTEQLSDNLFLGTLDEMRAYGREIEAILHQWTDEAGDNLSMLDVQRFSKEVHVQAYHLLAAGGYVLRTQTIFEHK